MFTDILVCQRLNVVKVVAYLIMIINLHQLKELFLSLEV